MRRAHSLPVSRPSRPPWRRQRCIDSCTPRCPAAPTRPPPGRPGRAASSITGRSRRAKAAQHVIDQVVLARPHPRRSASRAYSVVPRWFWMSRRPLCPPCVPLARDPQLAQRQVDVVADDQQIGQRQLIEVHDLPDAAAAQVHERLGLDQQHLLVALRSARPPGPGSGDWNRPADGLAARPSTTAKPTLCRVPSYLLPGLPRPTTTFMAHGRAPAGSADGRHFPSSSSSFLRAR